MTGSSDDSDTPIRRRKARRSCLNCQKSHRTCGKWNKPDPQLMASKEFSQPKTSGNERPCMECKRRGLTQTCVDGDRKIPKYLYGISKKTPTANLYCDTSLLHANLIPNRDQNFRTLHFDSIDQSGATVAAQVNTHGNYSAVNGSNDFVDPAILHIESPTLLLSRQMAKRHLTDESNPMTHLTADTGSLLTPPESNIASHMSESWGEKTCIGFTIGSGWSSTFLPCGMSEEPGGPINISSA